jgi:hypothetical protein
VYCSRASWSAGVMMAFIHSMALINFALAVSHREMSGDYLRMQNLGSSSKRIGRTQSLCVSQSEVCKHRTTTHFLDGCGWFM